MAKVQSDGGVWCYDASGNYMHAQRPHTGKAVSAAINGDVLTIQTDNGKTIVYEIGNGNIQYRSTR